MKKKDADVAREEFRQWLVKHTHCEVQTGIVNGKHSESGWPCGTCVVAFLGELGVQEHGAHNGPPDRMNEAWRAILQIRGETEA